jgi:hypothetical protein
MKLVSYRRDGAVRIGLIDGDDVVDLVDALGGVGALDPKTATITTNMVALIEAGAEGLDLARSALWTRPQ